LIKALFLMKGSESMVNLSSLHIAVVCHDAGGAEIVSSLSRRLNLDCKYSLFGPAILIFQRKIEGIVNQSIANALDGVDILICGTSSPSTYELEAISLARSRGIRSVAILDNWINYRERFVRLQQLIIPSEIWVVDKIAEQLASRALPEVSIKLIENPYKEDCLEMLTEVQNELLNDFERESFTTVLYVTEPTSEHAERKYGDARYWGYTEQEAVKYFFENIKIIAPNALKIIIRPHPSEISSKYEFALSTLGLEVIITKEHELISEIARVDIIAGCNSMAMVVGSWAKKRVVCCIPPGGRGFYLPDEGIEFARDDLLSHGH
jgi:hypothetical protein